MPKLPRLTARKTVAALQRDGFYIHHHKGSHVHLRHPRKPHLRVVVPYHKRDLAPKTLRSIIAQAELTVEQFRKII